MTVRATSFFLFVLALMACRKETFTTSKDALLSTSADTLHFDTVFTTTGSVTQWIKIFNYNNKSIKVATVKTGSSTSPFKINVDGTPGPLVQNITIAANDSAYVFVSVSINPDGTNLPFVVRDSLLIEYNGNTKKVQLEAYGQNAHFLRRHVVMGTETWTADKPYVILDGLLVAQNAQLNITKGCRIYTNAKASFIVDGTLNVQGEKWDSTRVIFTGDRLDLPYRNFPGSWPGIVFTPKSSNNLIEYATLKNAREGVTVQGPSAAAKLTLLQTIIDNALNTGILANNSSINAQNVLVSNCGKNIVLSQGGNYNFTHCTIAAFSNPFILHKDPLVTISNSTGQNTGNALSALFTNCIVWTENNNLVAEEVSATKTGTSPFNITFDNVLWPLVTPANITATGVVTANPMFVSTGGTEKLYDFHLKENSPALNKGKQTPLTLDLDGNRRPVGLPDLGAYEKQ